MTPCPAPTDPSIPTDASAMPALPAHDLLALDLGLPAAPAPDQPPAPSAHGTRPAPGPLPDAPPAAAAPAPAPNAHWQQLLRELDVSLAGLSAIGTHGGSDEPSR